MISDGRFESTVGEDTAGTLPGALAGTDRDLVPQLSAGDALVGETLIERAKSVIVVADRVDENEATQMLLDAASAAGVPVQLVAGQVMTALQSEADDGDMPGTSVHDTLIRALGVVRLVHPAPDNAAPSSSGQVPERTRTST